MIMTTLFATVENHWQAEGKQKTSGLVVRIRSAERLEWQAWQLRSGDW